MASNIHFKWKPDLGAMPTYMPLVTPISFGDGYEQRVGQSLNRVKVSWNLSFSRTAKECLEIRDFLISCGGLESFTWTTPVGETHRYVCREWQGPCQQMAGVYVLTATFEQVFES